jgi:RNA polymerase sigma factor (sigma-70 family)
MEYATTSFAGHAGPGVSDQDRRLAETFEKEARKLRNFIRRRVPDEPDAEDILQDVFFELTEAYRLMKPVAHTGAWLFQVARNKITDLFRTRKTALVEDGERLFTADLLPSPEEGPDAVYARRVLLGEIEAALDELPSSQREVFIAHEIDGRSFKEIAAETGVGVSTLLSRKHYAVVFLRRRLQSIYEETAGKETGRKTK